MRFFFIIIAIFSLSACAGMPMPRHGESWNQAYYRGQRARVHHAVPTPPPKAGFMYRAPVGWTRENPRSIQLKNESYMGARCWLDGELVLPTARGDISYAPIATDKGVVMAPTIPPKTSIHSIVSVGKHSLHCKLYAEPIPYQAAYEMYLEFYTDRGAKTFRLRPDLSPMRPIAGR